MFGLTGSAIGCDKNRSISLVELMSVVGRVLNRIAITIGSFWHQCRCQFQHVDWRSQRLTRLCDLTKNLIFLSVYKSFDSKMFSHILISAINCYYADALDWNAFIMQTCSCPFICTIFSFSILGWYQYHDNLGWKHSFLF